MAIDPFRVLGLPPGATVAEVKRAYRRLAKANHPDSAGAAALPRFLEIQRAYEALTSSAWRPGQRRPPTSPAATASWRADPGRARATPGAQPPGGTAEQRARGRAGTTGNRTNGAAGERTHEAAAGTAGRASPGSAGRPAADDASGGRRRSGSGSRADGPSGSRADGPSGRRRSARKATFGSTTYDEAREQADTRWSGASWYGPSSGEYWRVNPREYADPRKHGPEYQARAASRAAGAAPGGDRVAGAADGAPGAAAGAGAGMNEPAGRSRAHRGASSGPRSGGRHGPRSERGRGPQAATFDAGSTAAWGGDGTSARAERPPWSPPSERHAAHLPQEPPDRAGSPWPTLGASLSPQMRRLVRALIAWPPLGIAAAALIGEATGCAAFEASCSAPADLYPWAAQAVIVAVLLALPGVARILAGGTIAVAVMAFPVAAVLSAGGANYEPTYGPAALSAVLAVVWAVGVVAALLRMILIRVIP